MKKKVLLTGCLAALMLCLCGCGVDIDMKIKSDLTTEQTSTAYYTKEELQSLAEESETEFDAMVADFTLVEKDGKEYYAAPEEKEKLNMKATKENFVDLTKKHAVFQSVKAPQGDVFDELGIEFANYTITLPKKVVKTNCTVAEDGKTILLSKSDFDKKETLYAIFDKDAAKSKTITYSGVTKGKNYKVKKYITINSPNIIDKVVVKRNGKVYNYKKDELYVVGEKIYDNTYNRYGFVKDGKYNVKTTLINGASKSINFTVDRTKPTTNMKEKTYKKTDKGYKITFKDGTSGVKKATLNGKKIKTGKVVKKVGSYKLIVTDKAGNQKTIKFKIK